jgi:hypothetical protein
MAWFSVVLGEVFFFFVLFVCSFVCSLFDSPSSQLRRAWFLFIHTTVAANAAAALVAAETLPFLNDLMVLETEVRFGLVLFLFLFLVGATYSCLFFPLFFPLLNLISQSGAGLPDDGPTVAEAVRACVPPPRAVVDRRTGLRHHRLCRLSLLARDSWMHARLL